MTEARRLTRARVAAGRRRIVDVVPVDVVAWESSRKVPRPTPKADVRVRVLAAGGTHVLAVLPSNQAVKVPPFLERGDVGYIATVDDRFAGWVWLSRTTHCDPWSG